MTAKRPRPNRYLETKVLTASPVELRLMLYDGALRFLADGRAGMEERNVERMYEAFSRCRAIVLELLNSIDRSVDPELHQRLSGLYTYIYLTLVRATSERDLATIDEIAKLLEFERETWRLAMERLREENAAGAASADAVAHSAPPRPANAGARVPDAIVGARVSLRG